MPTKYEQWPSLRLYDRHNVPYVIHGGRWDGPLWTGHCMMLDATDMYGDAGFFHELCHWIEATQRQRIFPDFALGKHVNAGNETTFATSTTPFLHAKGRNKHPRDRNVGWGEETVLLTTATRQEENACFALWLYEPLVGLATWDTPPASKDTNSAAFDFNGSGETYLDLHTVKRVNKIVSFLAPKVSTDMIRTYVRALHDMKEDE